jgi:predicted RNA binding protein YcfA (HicA-like mRNA interferase family)
MLGGKDCEFLREIVRGKGTNVTYSTLARVLQRAGWELAGSRGSHRTWRNETGRRIVLVDSGSGDVLPVYAKRTAKAVLEGGECVED